MMQWRELNKRERWLVVVLVIMGVLMALSRKPETVGVEVALALAWVAFGLFFVMLGILIFVRDDSMEQLSAKAAKKAAENANARAKLRASARASRQR